MKKMTSLTGILVLVFGLVFIGCDARNGGALKPVTPGYSYGDGDSDVYIVGSTSNAYGANTYCYWKNGVKTDLPFPDGKTNGHANDLVVSSNGDVYVSGDYYFGNGDTSRMVCYWKNGDRTDLPFPAKAKNWDISNIAVAPNGDVYIAGTYDLYHEELEGNGYVGTWDNGILRAYTSVACYWKNGVRTDLTAPVGIRIWEVGNIAVASNGDVYISGSYSNGDTSPVCYWKNDVRTDLPIPVGTQGRAIRLAVNSNGDVCIVGRFMPDAAYASIDCYWKNGVRTDLSVPYADDSIAPRTNGTMDIAVSSDGDVHIIGNYDYYWGGDALSSTAYYWKNGVRTDLPLPAGTDRDLCGIAVAPNGDVYIAGSYQLKPWPGSWEGNTTTRPTACYWKNGVRTDLPLPDGKTNGHANGLAVSSNGDVYVSGDYYFSNGDTPRMACYWKNDVRTDLAANFSVISIAVLP